MHGYHYKKKRTGQKRLVIILVILSLGIIIYKLVWSGFSFGLGEDKYQKIEELIKSAQSATQIEKKGDIYHKALTRCESLLGRDPTDVLCLSYQGDIYFELAMLEKNNELKARVLEKSIAAYRKGIAFDKKNLLKPLSHYHLGLAYFEKGPYYYHESLDELQTALKLGFENPNIHRVLGIINLTKGDYASSVDELKKAIRADDETVTHYWLATAFKNYGMYTDAIAEYRNVLKNSQDTIVLENTHLGLGWLFYRQGIPSQAIKEYQQAIKLNPNSAKAHYWLGKVYMRKGEKSRALDAWRKALKIDPNFKAARLKLKK